MVDLEENLVELHGDRAGPIHLEATMRRSKENPTMGLETDIKVDKAINVLDLNAQRYE
ncbi:hypothetical protein YC2023_123979 [Brassica napus]